MKKILIIGGGAMGSAFSVPCVENNNRVTDQLEEIKTISTQLKNIVEKNTKLRENHVELSQITAQPEYMTMAKNMQEIKRQKEDIRNFLEKMGIVSPPLNF